MNVAQKLIVYLGISLILSFVFAVTWVVIMTLTLPVTDLAYGQSPFEDSIVLPIMSMFAVISAILVWPFYVVLGWRLPPLKVGTVVGIATFSYIFIVTPFIAPLGWLGSYVVLLIALIICRFTMKQSDQLDVRNQSEPNEDNIVLSHNARSIK